MVEEQASNNSPFPEEDISERIPQGIFLLLFYCLVPLIQSLYELPLAFLPLLHQFLAPTTILCRMKVRHAQIALRFVPHVVLDPLRRRVDRLNRVISR